MSTIGSSAWALGLLAALLATTATAQDNVYFGNLHAHTVYSDGSGTPDQAFEGARRAGLDFMAVTEHSHKRAEGAGDRQRLHIARDPQLYKGSQASSLISAARRRSRDGVFVALYGQEYSVIERGNHINVFEVPEVIDIPNREYRQLLEWTARNKDSTGAPALLQFNHPALDDFQDVEYGRNLFDSEAEWVAAMDAQVELIELFNGPAHEKQGLHRSEAVQEKDYYDYLNLGFHLAPSVGQDNHFFTWGTITDARVAVVAPRLTRTDVLAALKARHVYATADKNLRVVFRAGDALQGDIVTTPQTVDEDLVLTLTVKDDDEDDAEYRIDVFTDEPGGAPINPRRPANTFRLEGDTPTPMSIDGVPYRGAGQYVLVRITQLSDNPDDVDVAWTAPIWFGGEPNVRGGAAAAIVAGAPAPALRPLVLTKLLPDPAGFDLRNERIWLKNNTGSDIDLSDWTLVDLSGNVWRLSGSVPAGQERDFARNRQDLSLNNEGDRIELRDPTGRVVQVAEYGPTARDAEVTVR